MFIWFSLAFQVKEADKDVFSKFVLSSPEYPKFPSIPIETEGKVYSSNYILFLYTYAPMVTFLPLFAHDLG